MSILSRQATALSTFFLLILFGAASAVPSGLDQIQFDVQQGKIEIDRAILFLDPQDRLTPDDLINALKTEFHGSNVQLPLLLGVIDHPIWLRFEVNNPLAINQAVVIETHAPTLDHVKVSQRVDGAWQSVRFGDLEKRDMALLKVESGMARLSRT